MKSHSMFIVGALTILVFAVASNAVVKTAINHNRNEYATSDFKFKNIPSPSRSDAATKAKFTIVDGRRDRNGGNVDKLHDGKIPTEEDQPFENFFFNAGTDGGRLLVDLGGTIDIKQVNTYSWHPGTRGPQVYKLYAGDGKADDFNPRPKRGTDPGTCGWKLVARVDTRAKEKPGGGQYGVSICDSNGNIGKYHYLLFEISRTERTDPFGNTFYSEIDVVGPNTPVVVAAPATVRQGKTFEAEKGKYRITIDTSETPDLTEWAHKELAPVLQEWYPKIVKMLPSKGYQAPGRMSITFSPNMSGVAAASGTRVRCGAGWFRRQLQGEAKGAVVHELVHIVQQYGRARRNNRNATRTPGWLVEGIADYIRWFLYEPQTRGAEVTRRNIARARYDSSYRISGNFLNWVTETYDRNIVRKLNAAARQGKYNEELWKEATGHTVQELGDEWKRSLEKKIAAEADATAKNNTLTEKKKANKGNEKPVESTDAQKKTNAELAEEMAGKTAEALKRGPLSYPKGNGLRIVSTGHSWVNPALGALPAIAKAAGLDGHRQRKHIRGGGSGAARPIWLREIGRSAGNSEPHPILIPSIATGQWDVMTWGVFYNDKPENFEPWIEFCLRHNPDMVFYLQDGWTGTAFYKSEKELSLDKFLAGQAMLNGMVKNIIEPLKKKYPGKIHVIPVGNSMLELLKLYYDKKLPGIEGISKHLCKKEYTLWSDGGHLGKHMRWWEGYVYYATIYKKSPELINAGFEVTEYNAELDKMMRQCAWKAVVNHPYSGVTDKNANGIADQIEGTGKKEPMNNSAKKAAGPAKQSYCLALDILVEDRSYLH